MKPGLFSLLTFYSIDILRKFWKSLILIDYRDIDNPYYAQSCTDHCHMCAFKLTYLNLHISRATQNLSTNWPLLLGAKGRTCQQAERRHCVKNCFESPPPLYTPKIKNYLLPLNQENISAVNFGTSLLNLRGLYVLFYSLSLSLPFIFIHSFCFQVLPCVIMIVQNLHMCYEIVGAGMSSLALIARVSFSWPEILVSSMLPSEHGVWCSF